jgi:hypothetical protein
VLTPSSAPIDAHHRPDDEQNDRGFATAECQGSLAGGPVLLGHARSNVGEYVDRMSESDRSVLRRLADDGNEEAADRLAELAAARGDLDELRRLVDEGNENAADRLAEFAAKRGDLEELQLLVDEGNEKSEGLLSELIRNIK